MQEDNQNINEVRLEVVLEKIPAEIKELKEAMETFDACLNEPVPNIQNLKHYCSYVSVLFNSLDILLNERKVLVKNSISLSTDETLAEVDSLREIFEVKQKRITTLEENQSPQYERFNSQKMYKLLEDVGDKYAGLTKQMQSILEKNELYNPQEFKEFRKSYLEAKEGLKLLENSFNERDFSLPQQFATTIKKQIDFCKETEILVDKLISRHESAVDNRSKTLQQELIQQEQREKAKQAKKQEKRKAKKKANNAKKVQNGQGVAEHPVLDKEKNDSEIVPSTSQERLNNSVELKQYEKMLFHIKHGKHKLFPEEVTAVQKPVLEKKTVTVVLENHDAEITQKEQKVLTNNIKVKETVVSPTALVEAQANQPKEGVEEVKTHQAKINLDKIHKNPREEYIANSTAIFLSKHKKHRSFTDYEFVESREEWDKIYNPQS